MEVITFDSTINASPKTVWNVLWGETTYPQWAAVFSEGSQAITDWQQGSKVLFVDQTQSGMLSRVAQNVPNEYMSFEHLGMVKNGVEDTESEQAKACAGAFENYTLTQAGNQTHLVVEMQFSELPEEFKSFFEDTWPQAMDKIKVLAEGE